MGGPKSFGAADEKPPWSAAFLARLGGAPEVIPMGDKRFDLFFERVKTAKDRVHEIQQLSDDEVIAALGGASRAEDPLLANILATEAQNRAQRATAITASLGEGVIVLDKGWKIAMQNPAAERILGWTAPEFIGGDIHALIHPFCRAQEECHLGSLPPPDLFYQNDDALVLRKDGRTVRVAYTVTPVMRGDVVDGGVIVLRDSSERKRLEEKASERQDRLSVILQTITEGILTMDMAGRFTYANAAAERIIGRPSRDILTRTYYDPGWKFLTVGGGVLSVQHLPFKTALETGKPVPSKDLGIERGDGSIAWITVNTVPIPDANGVPYAILVSFLEIQGRERSRQASTAAATPERSAVGEGESAQSV